MLDGLGTPPSVVGDAVTERGKQSSEKAIREATQFVAPEAAGAGGSAGPSPHRVL